jgi:hypothetical protein
MESSAAGMIEESFVVRFTEAVVYGSVADELFEAICRERGLTPRYDYSPLLYLAECDSPSIH